MDEGATVNTLYAYITFDDTYMSNNGNGCEEVKANLVLFFPFSPLQQNFGNNTEDLRKT